MLDPLPAVVANVPPGLARLRALAGDNSPEALRTVAMQVEALFLQMMLKSMRAAAGGEGLLDNSQSLLYRDLFDQKLAQQLSEGGGLGLADVLFRQLSGPAAAADPVGSAGGALGLPGQPVPLTRAEVRRPEGGTAPPARKAIDPFAASMAATVPLRNSARPALKPDPGESRAAPSADPPEQAPAPSTGGRLPLGAPDDFVRQLWPHARSAAEQLGVSPKVLLAQAALETGWGRAIPQHSDGRSSHNLFGIKADASWSGARISLPAVEHVGDVAVRRQETFRSYNTFAESFADYANLLLSRPRYARALERADDPLAFLRALQEAGYATDPAYAQKIFRILGDGALNGTPAGLKFSAQPPLIQAEARVAIPGPAGGQATKGDLSDV